MIPKQSAQVKPEDTPLPYIPPCPEAGKEQENHALRQRVKDLEIALSETQRQLDDKEELLNSFYESDKDHIYQMAEQLSEAEQYSHTLETQIMKIHNRCAQIWIDRHFGSFEQRSDKGYKDSVDSLQQDLCDYVTSHENIADLWLPFKLNNTSDSFAELDEYLASVSIIALITRHDAEQLDKILNLESYTYGFDELSICHSICTGNGFSAGQKMLEDKIARMKLTTC